MARRGKPESGGHAFVTIISAPATDSARSFGLNPGPGDATRVVLSSRL